jgi:hypothetical protein
VSEIEVGAHALWSLVPVSIFAAYITVFIFLRYSDQHAVRVTTNRILAHLMEFRLFIDEPVLVMRANQDLLRENWRLFRLLFRPSAIAAVFFVVILGPLDAFYGRAPLRIGDPAVITVQLKNVKGTAVPTLRLKAPAAIAVETPAVHIVREGQISWRVRPLAGASGDLVVIGANRTDTKSIAAGSGIHYLSERRVSSLAAFLLHPVERPLSNSGFAWIEVRYPSATITHWPWLAWFLLVSSVAAIVIYVVS